MGNTGPFVLKFAERFMNDSQDHSDLTSNMSLNGQCGDDPTHTTLYIPYLGLYNVHWCIMRTPSSP